MRHYEIVFLVHPDQSEQVPAMIARYREIVENGGGNVHRVEDWGRRQLAYLIQDVHKAHYVMMNIECGLEALREVENSFRFNDAVIRNLVISRDEAIVDPSPLARAPEPEKKVPAEQPKAAAEETAKPEAPAAESTPAESTPAESAPAESTPAESAPADDASAAKEPAEAETPAEEATPVEDAPAAEKEAATETDETGEEK